MLLKKGIKDEFEKKIDLPDSLYAPVEKGEQVGTIEFYIDGELKKKADLSAGEPHLPAFGRKRSGGKGTVLQDS